MHGRLDRALITAAILTVCVAGWWVAGAAGILASTAKLSIYFFANLILSFDVIDLIVRTWMRRLHGAADLGPSIDLCLPELSRAELKMTLKPYAIVASVHNEADDIDRFINDLEPLKASVWLIDDASTDDTLLRLRRLGWNCMAGGTNRNKPGALRHLIKSLPSEIETIVVLDPDVRFESGAALQRELLERVVSDLQRSGAVAFSPRIRACRRGLLTECQALEYELGLGLGRKSLGDMSTNSGVSLYQRMPLLRALDRHSLSIYAEDFENSLLLLAAGGRVYYDDRLSFVTEAKATVKGLFSQRVGWSFGCVKVFLERWPLLVMISRRSPLAAYQYLFYLGFCGIGMLPFKLGSVALLAMSLANGIDNCFMLDVIPDHAWNDPIIFALVYLKTTAVLCIACYTAVPRGERLGHASVIPFYGCYALLQYAPMTIGYANVLTLKLFGRRLYADHYEADPRMIDRRAERAALTGS